MKRIMSIYYLCMMASLTANLVTHHKLARFIKKQKKTSQRYKDKPIVIINAASQLFGYGSVSKDDLYLLDRMPKSEYDIKKLIELYPVDQTISHERINRWRNQRYKRADVVKELRHYTAEKCSCTSKQAYGLMCDRGKIDDQHYFLITLQNLHDLYMFIKTVE